VPPPHPRRARGGTDDDLRPPPHAAALALTLALTLATTAALALPGLWLPRTAARIERPFALSGLRRLHPAPGFSARPCALGARAGLRRCPARLGTFRIFVICQYPGPARRDLLSGLPFYIIAAETASHGNSRLTLSDPPIPPALQPRAPARRRFAAPRTIAALMLREMSTRYGATPGGYLWAVAEPLGMIVILSVAFSILMRSPSLGESFVLFYATGYLPFHLFQLLSNMIMRSMIFSRPLLNYPVVTWMDTILARFLLNTLTAVLVAYLMLATILALTDTRGVLDMGPILGAFGLATLLGLGVGALNCALAGLFPVWQQVWGIATRPLFIASAVIFIMEDLPTSAQAILWWNPLVHVTGLARTGFYATYHPGYISALYVLGVALATMLAGFLLLRRFHRDILSR
jgi:capsular polysaccharide transport system permease protein